MELAKRILGSLPRGVEIGGSTFNPFPGVRSWNLDTKDNGLFQHAQQAIAGGAAKVDVYASADSMPFGDGVLDFVLASHVIEHMPDTIAALREWDRVLRPGGVCFLIVPHQERTSDHWRPRTELVHHLADFALGTTVQSDSMVPTSHYHVWITQDFVDLVRFLDRRGALQWDLEVVEDQDSKVGNGFTVVARKRAVAPPLPTSTDMAVAFHVATPVLPFQVFHRTLETVLPGPELPAELPLPAGRYRITEVLQGFPPRRGAERIVDVGAPHGVPELRDAVWDGAILRFRGRNLGPWTWLEARYPDGSEHRVLPRFDERGMWYDFDGVPLPDAFLVQAVAPAPGGGRSNAIVTPAHPSRRPAALPPREVEEPA